MSVTLTIINGVDVSRTGEGGKLRVVATYGHVLGNGASSTAACADAVI